MQKDIPFLRNEKNWRDGTATCISLITGRCCDWSVWLVFPTCFPVWSTDTIRRDLIATPASYPKKSLSFSWGNGDPAVNLPLSIAGQTSRCMGGQSLAQCHQSLDVQPQAFGSHGHLNCNSNATWSSPLARTSHMRLQGPQRKPGSARDSTVKNFARFIYVLCR